MHIENEIKYLIDKLPDELPEPYYIEQRYFSMIGVEEFLKEMFNLDSLRNISTSRIRLIKHHELSYVVTLKSKGLYSRLEYEKELSLEQYNLLTKQPITSYVIKNRYKINVDNFTFEFDEYLSLRSKLYTVEVEVSDTDIDKYRNHIEKILESKFNLKYKDVTFDPRYKNSNLYKYF